jgi:DNA-binding MarR family transcriptional regulator
MIEPRLPDSTRRFGSGANRPAWIETSSSPADYALTVPQLRTLVELKSHGAKTMPSIAAALSMSESRIVRVCTDLVVRGLVIHVPGTGKDDEVVVALSTGGDRVAGDLVERGATQRRSLADALLLMPDQ